MDRWRIILCDLRARVIDRYWDDDRELMRQLDECGELEGVKGLYTEAVTLVSRLKGN